MMAELNASYMPHKLAGPLLAETSFCGAVNGERSQICQTVSHPLTGRVLVGLIASLPRTVGGQQFVVAFDVRFVRFFEQQTALNLANISHEWA